MSEERAVTKTESKKKDHEEGNTVALASILGGFGAGYGYCKHKSH